MPNQEQFTIPSGLPQNTKTTSGLAGGQGGRRGVILSFARSQTIMSSYKSVVSSAEQ